MQQQRELNKIGGCRPGLGDMAKGNRTLAQPREGEQFS